MNFEFSDEQNLLREQAQGFLQENCPLSAVRAILDSDAAYDQALWGKMAELGWTATTIPEQHGGLGLGYLELCVIAEELGRAVAPLPFSSSVYLATEALLAAGSEAQREKWLPKLATGEAIGTFALAEGAWPAEPRQVVHERLRRPSQRRQAASGRWRHRRLRGGGGEGGWRRRREPLPSRTRWRGPRRGRHLGPHALARPHHVREHAGRTAGRTRRGLGAHPTAVRPRRGVVRLGASRRRQRGVGDGQGLRARPATPSAAPSPATRPSSTSWRTPT